MNLVAQAIPLQFFTYISMAIMDVFVPVTSRTGTEVPPDVVLSVLCAFIVVVLTSYLVSAVKIFYVKFCLLILKIPRKIKFYCQLELKSPLGNFFHSMYVKISWRATEIWKSFRKNNTNIHPYACRACIIYSCQNNYACISLCSICIACRLSIFH